MNRLVNRRRLYNELLRHSLAAFVEATFRELYPSTVYHHNWHIDCVCWHLEQVAAGKIKRLIITLPPRHLKSFMASAAYSAWLLGLDPTRKIISVSYSHGLGANLTTEFRKVLASKTFAGLFPGVAIGNKNSETEQVLTRGGWRYST